MRQLHLATCLFAALSFVPALPAASAQQPHPRDHEIPDPDTRAWWHTTEDLSGDSMEGRDTGSAAYGHAADYVAKRFQAAGLRPAGDNGTWFQTIPLLQTDLTPDGTSFVVVRNNGTTLPLRFLYEITTTPATGEAPHITGVLTFRGYCGSDAMHDITGKVVVCFGTQRQGLPSGADRLASARAGHAAAVINVDDPYFTIEPPRWPYAYARSVTFDPTLTAGVQHGASTPVITDPAHVVAVREQLVPTPVFRLSAAAFTHLLEGTGQDAAALLKTGGAKQPLPSFDLQAHFSGTLHTTTKQISSPNVLAVLPGSDPALRDQYVVVAAHLDGYGFGTPVAGDNLYNGTLDDAAYVALLLQMADDLHKGQGTAGSLPAPKRSILFCAFTGEEKGLLGSTWFVHHPTVPIAQMAADINLDQLRPLFPLRILTALAIHDTTLGATAAEVAKSEGIQLREDREPERGLLRRADHYPFLKAGVPAIGFIFGFDPGTDEERRYRHWYEVQYHRPQDDLTQPVNFDAARKFNTFFYSLVQAVADAQERPRLLPSAKF